MVGVIEPQEARTLAKKAGAGLTGAAAGLALGGPLGAVAGAITAPMLELLVLRESRGLANIALLESIVTDLSGLSSADVASWAREQDGRLHLVTTAMHAAYMTAVRQKIGALARVVADNIHDDAKIDCSSLVLAALAQIEAPHIRVLHAMVHETPPDPPDGLKIADGAWCQSQLAAHLPGLRSGIVPVATMLVSTGMVEEGMAADDDNRAWFVTSFGIACLEHVETSQS
jgi:hypothetical protein